MALKDDLVTEVGEIFRSAWSERDGEVIPEPADLKLGNDAVNLEATVLYADMNGSTDLVDNTYPNKAAEIYKAYMVCAARIIKAAGGCVTAYDGDRIMAVFIGKSKNSTAAKVGLKINWALSNIVNKCFGEFYTTDGYRLKHMIGIDTSSILVCRIGVRNDNDLVWVGPSANWAAKLTAISDDFSGVYLTPAVFEKLNDESKYGGEPRRLMWEQRFWRNTITLYRSSWIWPL